MSAQNIRSSIVYIAGASSDGYVADDNNAVDWLLDPRFRFFELLAREFDRVGAVIMGPTTRDIVERVEFSTWPGARLPWFIVERRHRDGGLLELFERAMRAADGRMVAVFGSRSVMFALTDLDLIGEMAVFEMPVTFGDCGGWSLFPVTRNPYIVQGALPEPLFEVPGTSASDGSMGEAVLKRYFITGKGQPNARRDVFGG